MPTRNVIVVARLRPSLGMGTARFLIVSFHCPYDKFGIPLARSILRMTLKIAKAIMKPHAADLPLLRTTRDEESIGCLARSRYPVCP